MENRKKSGGRNKAVDDIRAVGICLIALSHIFGAAGQGTNAVWRFMAPFFVGIFFIISGFMEAEKERVRRSCGESGGREACSGSGRWEEQSTEFPAFVRKRTASLLIPYFFYSAAALAVKLLAAHLTGGSLREQAVPALREFVTLLGTGTLWFLPAMFLGTLLFYGIRKLSLPMRLGSIPVSIAAAQYALTVINAVHAAVGYESSGAPVQWTADLLFVLFRGITAAGLMEAGYDLFPVLIRGRKAVLTAEAVLCGGFMLLIPKFCFPDFRSLNFDTGAVFVFLDSMAAAVFLHLLFEFLESRYSLSVLNGIGEISLLIMCTHNEWMLVRIYMAGLAGILGPMPGIGRRYYLECGLILLLILLTERGLAEWIQKLPFGKYIL